MERLEQTHTDKFDYFHSVEPVGDEILRVLTQSDFVEPYRAARRKFTGIDSDLHSATAPLSAFHGNENTSSLCSVRKDLELTIL